ncbi:MAG: methyltransferase [Acetobacteraceae bacterium]
MNLTQGRLLGGRLAYAQPATGYRTGIEPVLLAASIPARPGERVIEGGTGAGAGLMCLAARVQGIVGLGVELDPAMAALARDNIAANDLPGLEILTGDITQAPAGTAEHAFANPPWHDRASTPSPVPRRQLAKQASGAGIEGWIAALRRSLRPGGSLTLILPAGQAARAASAMRFFGLFGHTLTPLLPRADAKPKLVLLSARLDAGEDRVNPGIVLHEADGSYTAEITAVLRGGEALPLPK